ncbi:MAG: hypothetical protein HN683_19610 [Gammaproteobacteria bacterium]|nr:hypothetical protein [Gammaproteobacteria bacterium]
MTGKYASVGFMTRRGSKNSSLVKRDSDGSVGGVRTEHWDGRVDATVVPQSVDLKVVQKDDKN